MNKKSLFRLVCVALLFLFGTVEAADIEAASDAKGHRLGLLSGKISSGDTERVAKFFLKYSSIKLLHRDSRGGDVIEAVRLGELVRTLRLQVQVADRGVCASSCFFVWLNGAYRHAVSEAYKKASGPVGLHRPFLVNPDNQEDSLQRQSDVIVGVRNYLESNLIPRRLIDTMMSRPSNDIYWLTVDDLDELSPTPPALEELYISKCQTSIRKLQAAVDEAKAGNDSAALARTNTRMDEFFSCTLDLDFDANAVALKKLASGWLPPVPFKGKK